MMGTIAFLMRWQTKILAFISVQGIGSGLWSPEWPWEAWNLWSVRWRCSQGGDGSWWWDAWPIWHFFLILWRWLWRYETWEAAQFNLLVIVVCLDFDWLSLWSAGGSSRGRRQRRGEDVVHPLKVSLEELYNGTSKKLSLSRNVLCSKCNGYVISFLLWVLNIA